MVSSSQNCILFQLMRALQRANSQTLCPPLFVMHFCSLIIDDRCSSVVTLAYLGPSGFHMYVIVCVCPHVISDHLTHLTHGP